MNDDALFNALKRASYVLFCALLFAASACSSEATKFSNAEEFPVTSPAVLDTVFSREYVAEIQSIQNVELRARVRGFIEKIHVDEGQDVRAGQTLFTMSSQQFREEIMKARSMLKSAIAESKVAEVELKNTKALLDRNIVSVTEWEMAQAKLEAIEAKIDEARSAISSAELSLSFTVVKAPFDGTINRIPNKKGSLVEEGELLTSISNNQEVFAYFYLSEKEYLDFRKQNILNKGQQVSLISADNLFYGHDGKVETVESEIDPNTGTIGFRARFPNPEGLLRHGSSGKVIVHSALEDAMIIPQRATFEIQDNTYVYIIDEDSVARMRVVVPKFRMSNIYVLESGLAAGDKIILEGIQRVKDGDRVSPVITSFESVSHHLAKQ